MKTTVHTDKAPAAIGPYSQAISVNGFLYISGQIALNPETMELEMENIQTETKRVMTNVKAILNEAGMDFSNVVKTSIFLSNMELFASVNEVYGLYFDSNGILPARETVAVLGLPKDVNVEVSLIAYQKC